MTPQLIVDAAADIGDGELMAGIEALESRLGFTSRKRVEPRIAHAGHHTLAQAETARLSEYYSWLEGREVQEDLLKG